MTALVRRVLQLVRDEPVRCAAAASVLLGWSALAGVPDPIVGGLGTLLAAVLGVHVRGAVVPVPKAAQAAVDTAVAAAAETAARLDPAGVGEVGEITDQAREAITAAATGAIGDVLYPAGLNPKGRKVVIR